MLVACRLAGLSTLETYYADFNRRTQCGRRRADQCIVGKGTGPGPNTAGGSAALTSYPAYR
jgi:hypothetical protein